MGISRETLNQWEKKYSDISDALKKGKELADYIMENALYRRGTGYTVTIKKPIKVKNTEYEDGRKIREKEQVVYADEEIHIPADTTAAIFWLKNRKPEKWRDKRIVEENKTEYESDGFLEAMKEQAAEVFKEAEKIVET